MASKTKQLMAAELAERYSDCREFIVVGAEKLNAVETTDLRRDLRQSKVEMHVVKNTIVGRVFKDLGMRGVDEILTGPCAVVSGEPELPEICKLVIESIKKFEDKLVVRGGFMGGNALSPDTVTKLASIPPMPVLRAQIVGGFQAPITGVASAFQCILRSLARALDGIREQKEEGGAAPSAS